MMALQTMHGCKVDTGQSGKGQAHRQTALRVNFPWNLKMTVYSFIEKYISKSFPI